MRKPKLYTVDEAAPLLNLSRSALYRLVKAERVPHRRWPNGRIYLTDADIAQILDDAHRPAVA